MFTLASFPVFFRDKRAHARPRLAGESLRLAALLALPGLIPASASPADMEPARTVSSTLHGEIVTLSPAAAHMVDPAMIWNFPIHFEHPMTVTTAAQLAWVKEQIAHKREPQYSAWLDLQKNAVTALRFEAQPPAHMDIQGGYEQNTNLAAMRAILYNSASAAYTLALTWRLTDDDRYAARAAEILDAWAAADTVFEGKDRGLQLSSHFTPMLYAVDLLAGYQDWSSSARHAFEAFWRRRVLPHIQFVMLRWNNWGDNGTMGAMAAGIAFEDEMLVRRSLARLNDYFFGNWKIRRDDRGTFLLDEVERNQGRSGLTYTAYAMQGITQLLEMARNFGPEFDWWSRVTTAEATMQSLVECFFAWNMLKQPFPWYDENFKAGHPKYAHDNMNTLEVAHTRLADLDPRIGAWLRTHRPVNGRTADPYSTLLKGTP